MAYIRIPQLEDVYRPYRMSSPSDEGCGSQTVVLNCDNFFSEPRRLPTVPAKEFEGSLKHHASELMEQIVRDVLPALQRFSTAEALMTNLTQPDPRLWIVSNRLQRSCILLAYAATHHDEQIFESYAAELNDFVSKPRNVAFVSIASDLIAGIRKDHFEI